MMYNRQRTLHYPIIAETHFVPIASNKIRQHNGAICANILKTRDANISKKREMPKTVSSKIMAKLFPRNFARMTLEKPPKKPRGSIQSTHHCPIPAITHLPYRCTGTAANKTLQQDETIARVSEKQKIGKRFSSILVLAKPFLRHSAII